MLASVSTAYVPSAAILRARGGEGAGTQSWLRNKLVGQELLGRSRPWHRYQFRNAWSLASFPYSALRRLRITNELCTPLPSITAAPH
jgi:hypothetical protein